MVHTAAENGASDVHIVVFNPGLFRIKGAMQAVGDMPPLTPDEINEAFKQITSEEQRANFKRNLELDFGYSVPAVSRMRTARGS